MAKAFTYDMTSLHFEKGRNLEDISKEELLFRIYHDTITGYYNWNYMWKYLDKSLVSDDYKYCFVHFNIKEMKLVNDIYGHKNANDLLCAVCNQMEEEKNAGWVYQACRCDNDNFSMIIKTMPQEEIKEKLTAFFEKISFLPCDHDYKIFYRCGVVTADDAIKFDERVADYAKFAQNMGRKYNITEINFFTAEMYQKMRHDKEILGRLDEAILNNEFYIMLQPKYDIHSEKIVGAEALIRWNYEHKKMVFPNEFIPVFESNGVIGKLDQEVLRQTCIALANMRDQGLPLLPISVNLSRLRLKNPFLKDDLLSVIDSYKIPHEAIEFELTESAAYNDEKAMVSLLNDLHSIGFKVSLDDFGTGYSSLSILRKIPMDTLKIDKSFVDVINPEDEKSRENYILKDIITMSKHLGFICLAEGAENKVQVDFLRAAGCEKIQGYYYSKPILVDDFINKIKNGE